jgi:hypothetical protein
MARLVGLGYKVFPLLLLAGCTGEPSVLPPESSDTQPGVVASSAVRLLEAGCRALSGPRTATTIVVAGAGVAAVPLECEGVPPEVVRRILAAGTTASGIASAKATGGGGDGGLVYAYTHYECELTHYYNYVPAMGEYIYVYTDANCIFTEVYTADGGGGGGGGSGGGSPTPSSQPPYCPNSDPNCLRPLRSEDLAKINQGLALVNRNVPICATAYNKISGMLAAGRIFRGNPEVADGPNGEDHDAASRSGPSGFVHVDHDYLGSSTPRGVAGLLLHEGWHLLGHPNHPATESQPYSTYPYSQEASCFP